MKREIKSSTAWIIIAAAVVLLFGGALSWAYYGEPNDYDYSNGGTLSQQKTETTAVDETADWKTYEVSDLKLSFKYPVSWGDASLSSNKADTGSSKTIKFTKSNVTAGYASTDFSAGRSGAFYEGININKNISKIKDCASYKQYSQSEGLKTCKDILVGSNTIGMVLTYDFPAEGMITGPYTMAYYFTGNAQIPVIGLETPDVSTVITSIFENIIKSVKKSTTLTNVPAATTNTSTTTAVAWKTYENTDYGFGLTFTDVWEGYKLKAVDLDGTVKTFYVNVPTKDPIYASETSTAYAGYAAPFAISVIEKSKWQDDELFARDFGSKVGEKGNYVFASSSWQACPTDLCNGDITSSLKTVMDSFKVL